VSSQCPCQKVWVRSQEAAQETGDRAALPQGISKEVLERRCSRKLVDLLLKRGETFKNSGEYWRLAIEHVPHCPIVMLKRRELTLGRAQPECAGMSQIVASPFRGVEPFLELNNFLEESKIGKRRSLNFALRHFVEVVIMARIPDRG